MSLKASNLMLDLEKSDDRYKCYTTSYIKILGQTIDEVVGDHWIEMVIDEKEIESFVVNG